MDSKELQELEAHLHIAAHAVSKLAAEKKQEEAKNGVTGVASTLILLPGTPIHVGPKEGVYLGSLRQMTGATEDCDKDVLIMSCPEWDWGTYKDRNGRIHRDWYSFNRSAVITKLQP